ncbi:MULTISPECIES: hypothetical protein [Streptomyces]|uniref:Lipoprotein n=1 Tax=Streptomyces solicathayae TaxID=3081768 RepID=A0ABZ0LS49_9ACTN|nr:hypothetical protein [Streptomyces sp. HUAS YS2]WOX22185.1 hypothetical protein R2D22_12625 [Streptomyces sp. HUAS YS2]
MASTRKLWIATTVCAALALTATGCSKGGDGKAEAGKDKKASPSAPAPSPSPVDPFAGLDADAIADKAIEANKAASSMHAVGTIKADGESVDIDFSADTKGACNGKMTLNEGTAELRKVQPSMYVKGDEKFWTNAAAEDGTPRAEAVAMAEVMKGRWIKMSAKEAGSDFDMVCNNETMMKELDKDKSDRKGMTRGADADVDGVPAATLVKRDADGGTLTFYVAKEGKPYLLKAETVGGKDAGLMTFSEFDKPVVATAPPADQMLDMSKLG